jgi:rRNA-processing protein FCF1
MVVAVVVDTSFLLIPAEFGIDVFAESKRVLERSIDFIVLTSVLQEIGTGTKSGDSLRDRKFQMAGDLAKQCRTVTIDSSIAGIPVDDQLLEYTISIKGILATNDRRLRERARERGLPVLLMRGKKRLALEGGVV